ncbi:MAG: hypothetical protein ACM3S2_13585, partial [Ignavibacteriales bacterium]
KFCGFKFQIYLSLLNPCFNLKKRAAIIDIQGGRNISAARFSYNNSVQFFLIDRSIFYSTNNSST